MATRKEKAKGYEQGKASQMTERVELGEIHEERRRSDAGELEHIGKIISRVFSEPQLFLAGREEWPEPPYDSPIETIFASCCFKHLRSDVHVEKQVEVSTGHGHFRIDFVLSVGDRRIAVECDGKDFHEPFRDEFRDAILLGEGHFETVYHFRGCDIVYCPDDCIWLMSVLEPRQFSERGHLQLDHLHRLQLARLPCQELTNREHLVGFVGETYHFCAFRRNISMKSEHNPSWPHWKVLHAFAGEHSGASLDELLENRLARWREATEKD